MFGRFKFTPAKILKIGIVATAYFITAKFGLGFDAVSGFATLVWPPAGIALAAILIWGYEMSLGVAIGAFAINLHTGAPVLAALGIMVGNTSEGILGAYLLRRLSSFNGSLNKISVAVTLIFFSSLIASTIAATIGTTSLFVSKIIPVEAYFKTWLTWWIGDALGALIIGSFLISWSRMPKFKLTPKKIFEILLLVAALCTIILVVFTDILGSGYQFAYLTTLPIIWASARFKEHGATLATLAMSIAAIWGTTNGIGPFTRGELSLNLLQLDVYMLVISIVALFLSTSRTELEESQEQYIILNRELEQRIKDRTSMLQDKNDELEKMNKFMMGREVKMAELKQRMADMEKGLNKSG